MPKAVASADEILDSQRAAFRSVHAEVEQGNWQSVHQYEALLKDYVLWPDLRATYLRARLELTDDAEIIAFLNQYGVLKPARELRYRYALHLAQQNRMSDYLDIYRQFYQGLEIANLDCLALQAEIILGQENRVTKRAQNLWLVGNSQADECDPVFEHLRSQDLLDRNLYTDRFNLAIASQNFTLARYLAGSIDKKYLNEANEWIKAQAQPADFIAAYIDYADTELTRKHFVFAVERLAFDDPLAANDSWHQLARRFSFSKKQLSATNRHIALWAARARLPQAEKLLSSLAADDQDIETGKWQVRARLIQRDWRGVVDSVDSLPDDEAQKAEWQYWKAIALQETGRVEAATAILDALAHERSYYGFLAADAVSAPYSLTEKPVLHDPEISLAIEKRPDLIRARELFFVGLEGRGRGEWDDTVRLMNSDEKTQAALLADSWGWHSRAISTVAKAGQFDDLRVRYPLPWRNEFETHADNAGISYSWVYGIARSESLFMPDIRSSAGAIGLMQLMPETGRRTALEIQMPWKGQATLTDSSSNIRLGIHYLHKMFYRFAENRVLATAAYNAGPLRVEAWLPETGSLDARIWIENIPFNETRDYVRRVLTDDAIFSWRMTGQQSRISNEMPLVAAAGTPPRVASLD
ncbi:MAG: transglycosylase SLT domain-containing protein [Proteobacteria bacterium]|nr:transglycosylase SLT domain-containing protein [Pseudomonadota bacterium]MDA0994378.1 transglycosylase SLT domain-containing protein [Pseudomonadota bacterium]